MNSIPARADVVVIGGGPAGSTAANMLASNGYDVVLLDKSRHPRLVVGESILPHVWKYIEHAGAIDDIDRIGFIRKSGGTGIWRGVIRQMRLGDFGFTRPSLHVEREEFDEALLRAAERRGARVFDGVAARNVGLEGISKRVTWHHREGGESGEIECRYIVDASGQAAVIANQLGIREFDKDLRFMSVWGYYDNSSYIAQGGVICPWEKRREIPPTTIQQGIGDWGWCWHIVQKEHTSVGLVLSRKQAAEFKSSGEPVEVRLDKEVRKLPIIGDLLENATLAENSVYAIRDFAYRPSQLAGDGWFLAGDAAAFVDPINSAGVVTAFYAGFSAAWAIDFSLKQERRRDYYRRIFSELVRQRLTLFRVSALPEGVNTYPEDNAVALRAAQLDSILEQELLFAQCNLTDRKGNLDALLEIDPRLQYRESSRFRVVKELTPLSEMQPA
jgi:flavin-dependent dehydrogenase